MEQPSIIRGLRMTLWLGVVHGTGLRGWSRLRIYVACAVLMLACLWIPVTAFIKYSPVSYTSKWTLILPGTGLGTSVNLDKIGQAATAVSSPYTSPSLDPRANYKAIIESQPVLAAAAERVGLSLSGFGKPRIKLVDQTALMLFSINAGSAKHAQQKALAINAALTEQLEQLRLDEAKHRGFAVELLLEGFQVKLDAVQNTLLTYQADSGLASLDQLKELTLTIERLRKDQALMQASYQQSEGQVAQLAQTLDISPKLAADALRLQADPIFQQYLQAYAEAQTQLVERRGKWGKRHPQVKQAQQHVEQALGGIMQRQKTLLGSRGANDDDLQRLLLGKEDKRGELFRELITAHAANHGTAAQVSALEQALEEFQQRLQRNSRAAAGLADLQRKHQVASAVFSTALAKLDMGKSNPFASYPLVQVLAAPTLPEGPDTMKRKLALLGAAGGSVFGLIGLALLWKRQVFFRKILKNA